MEGVACDGDSSTCFCNLLSLYLYHVDHFNVALHTWLHWYFPPNNGFQLEWVFILPHERFFIHGKYRVSTTHDLEFDTMRHILNQDNHIKHNI